MIALIGATYIYDSAKLLLAEDWPTSFCANVRSLDVNLTRQVGNTNMLRDEIIVYGFPAQPDIPPG